MDPKKDRLVAGRYRLLSPLGSGGMGTVWRASDEVLGREVAVKEVTFPHGLSDEDREVLCERTRREARAAARLDHPSAVTVYDVVEEDGSPYLVMELVEARTLSQVVRDDGPLTPRRTAQVGLALLGALETAHRQGIVHRDVKPGNVLLCPGENGRVVLTDFGIASSVGDSSITSTGLLLGSPSYIAPERAKGQTPGPASDLWSLGATLFTAVEGRPPFDGGEPLLTVTAVVTGEHEPFVAAGPLEPVLEGLLEREPEQRMTSAQARAALTPLAASAPTAAAPVPAPAAEERSERTAALPMLDVLEAAETEAPAAAPARPRPPRVVGDPRPARRSRAPLALAGLAVVGAAALGGYALTQRDGGSDRTPSAAGTPAASSAPSESDAPASGTGAEPAPDGWKTYTGGAGWTAAVPPSYAVGSFNGAPQYKDASTGRTLRVSTTSAGGGKSDVVQDRRDQAKAFRKKYPDYKEIAISPVDFRDAEAADWEFTYTSGGASLHAISRVFVVDDRGYSLFFQTRSSDDWDAAKAEFEQLARSFGTA